jgi:hypothetical protein
MRWYPSRDQVRQSWEKYGLIVIGNIVFFALLYFVSYRPHNTENRAAEFLSVAQSAEAEGRHEAALVVYRKLAADYPKTRAGATAAERLPLVRKLAIAPARPEPELVPPRIDLSSMLDRTPAVYVAAYLAAHYRDDPSLTPRIHEAIERYLSIAFRAEGLEPARLAREPEFQGAFFQAEFFAVKPKCLMTPDWIWDDFAVQNANFYPWTNANVRLTVRQGDAEQTVERRVPRLEPGAFLDLLEFRVRKTGGVVRCEMEVHAAEGATSRAEDL